MIYKKFIGLIILSSAMVTNGLNQELSTKISFFETTNAVAIYSLIIPGMGQFVNRHTKTGGIHLGVAAGLHYSHYFFNTLPNKLNNDDIFDDENKIKFINRPKHWSTTTFRMTLNWHFYSSFAAYRDSRKMLHSNYSTKAPPETWSDIISAPVSVKYLTRWTTLIPLTIITGIMALEYQDLYETRWADDMSKAEVYTASILSGSSSAFGEEAFFRGYLNNEFSSRLGNVPGILLSSAIFAVTHGQGGNNASILSAALFGGYLGWLHQHNDYDIGEGIFIHFWINAIGAILAIEKGGPVNKDEPNPFYFQTPVIQISF